MSRPTRAQAKNAKRAAESDLRFWKGKKASARDDVSRQTYDRAIKRAQDNIRNADRQIKRSEQ